MIESAAEIEKGRLVSPLSPNRYGDAIVCLCPTQRSFEMPTAIITAYTLGGMFIAADGRTRREHQGVLTVLNDDQQKIFHIADDRACFAFAVTGTAKFTPDDDDSDILFDFNAAVTDAANGLRHVACADALDFCNKLSTTINSMLERSVRNAQEAGKPIRYPSNSDQFGGEMIAFLFLCGHYSHIPLHIVFRFFHRAQNLAVPEVVQRLVVGNSIISGSQVVSSLLYESSDPRFAEFRFRPAIPGNLTFEEWATDAKNYVAACESEAGLAEDPVLCPGIGGHVHCAKVTPDGFEWIVPPLNFSL